MQSKEEEKRASMIIIENSRAHEPTGDFVYPMWLPAIARFEILNEVQVNVFRLVAVLIFTFFNWCEAVSKHIRTNGWLHIRWRIIIMMSLKDSIKISFKIFL